MEGTAMTRHQQLAMSEPTNMKVMDRLIRRIKQSNWSAYEGYSINIPRVGDVLIHIRTPIGRQSIRISSSGAMYWYTPPVMTAPELMAAE